MTKPTLAVYQFGHDLVKIQYPFVASVRSALALTRFVNGSERAGKVYFALCDCTDATSQVLLDEFAPELRSGELLVPSHAWGDHHTIQAHICNFLLDLIGTDETFALKLDADEVLHESSFANFFRDLDALNASRIKLARPHYTHLLDPKRETDFIYRSKATISRTDSGLRFDTGVGGDACAIGGAPEAQTQLEILHYGKWSPGRRQEALLKEITFTKLYKELGFPDQRVVSQIQQGYLDYDRVFEIAQAEGHIRPWLGTHPIFAKEWVRESLERDKQFFIDLAEGRIQPLETENWWA